MFSNFFAKRRIRKFLTSMSRTLATDYGRSPEYTEGQVKTALKKLGYNQELEETAIGVFCNESIAKAFGMDEALIKRYKGYPREHGAGIGSDGGGSDFGGDGGGGGSD